MANPQRERESFALGLSERERQLTSEAVNLQIQRFTDLRAKKWNYGTHAADKCMAIMQSERGSQE
eukprot:6117132-Amphidinium_carterae.2